jgi:hypothetical protein
MNLQEPMGKEPIQKMQAAYQSHGIKEKASAQNTPRPQGTHRPQPVLYSN